MISHGGEGYGTLGTGVRSVREAERYHLDQMAAPTELREHRMSKCTVRLDSVGESTFGIILRIVLAGQFTFAVVIIHIPFGIISTKLRTTTAEEV
jgi:hypothetical protein